METEESVASWRPGMDLLTSSEVELMETRPLGPLVHDKIPLLTSSEVELMETMNIRPLGLFRRHASDFLGS